MEELMIQQIKEFKYCLDRFKKMDDEMESIYEKGELPTRKQEREFAKIKIEYEEFIEYFKAFDVNIFGSAQWTPLSLAKELIARTWA